MTTKPDGAGASLDRGPSAVRRCCRADRKPTTTRPAADYHADLPLVSTPTIRQVITTSRLLIQLNRNQVSARRGVIICGASGTGKTTALTQLGRTHERHIRKRYPADRYRLPVLYVTVPPAATPRMLAVEFARFLGLPVPGRGRTSPTSSTPSAPPPRTPASSWSASTSCTTLAGHPRRRRGLRHAEVLLRTAAGHVRLRRHRHRGAGLFAGTRGRQIAGRFTVMPAAPFAYGTGEHAGSGGR